MQVRRLPERSTNNVLDPCRAGLHEKLPAVGQVGTWRRVLLLHSKGAFVFDVVRCFRTSFSYPAVLPAAPWQQAAATGRRRSEAHRPPRPFFHSGS